MAQFRQRYPRVTPDPYAIYGYEAMKVVIDAIARSGPRGKDRAAVLDALRSTRDRQSVLGTYSFDANGDTTLTRYGIYHVGRDGFPRFSFAIDAALGADTRRPQ